MKKLSEAQLRHYLYLTCYALFCMLVIWYNSPACAMTYELHYSKSITSEIDPNTAMLSAMRGERVYKCQTMEFKVGKSGTSASLKNVAKPKAKEDIQAQIKMLESQLKETK